ncbi:2-isopropylmalate synthase/homocitrate synthase family protein, putative [Heliomicrobium modesticaldum Ice1]|uniref:Citramalate synthase n=1 Tax=Heliobacterium modesticaldum (strain ATCC 51547 / Ice1) TaxID=498761 RepID=B0TCR5_HELMI|nr:citramalate synthase [Heliomicrobium modesticaldum]ABZ84091.1 2-isopropylmalate synthase/homocitrate synthase family protein, putative [Heliomicrobium modesticaldum Ice1]
MDRVFIYDTTLRDGTQGEGISLSVEDKVKIAARLDQLGVAYIEGGWPGSNPKDMEFFQRAQQMTWKHAKIAAFGSTCRPGSEACDDPNLRALIESGAPVVTIFGKSWDFHVTAALRTTLEENLRLVRDSITFLKNQGREVIFDAEHFYDGYKGNPAYAKEVVMTAEKAGADWIVLCDTNGGTLPHDVLSITQEMVFTLRAPVGVHVHNDGDLAVANSIMGVMAGARQVQGTMNGYGERCGNVNLCSVIPNLQLKMKMECLPEGKLQTLTDAAHFVGEIANMPLRNDMPFVGHSAFAHKGGIHVSALMKDPGTYEHIQPEAVGNHRRVLVSELSGMSNVIYKAKELGLDVNRQNADTKQIIEQIKNLEHQGFQFEGAEASFEVLLRRAFGEDPVPFVLDSIRLIIEKRSDADFTSEAMIKLRVGDQVVHTAAEGNGPVNAVDNALRKALLSHYPFLAECHLTDYKVRVLDGKDATEAKVRVLIETRDSHDAWGTVGVSTNIIEASWQALMDSFLYGYMRERARASIESSRPA